MNKEIKNEDIYMFVRNRWDFYKERDGVYLPSKHDKQVYKDASKEFGIPDEECECRFNAVNKGIAEEKVKKAIASGKIEALFDEILVANGESPWGLKKIYQKFYSDMSELEKQNITKVYINIYEEEASEATQKDNVLSMYLYGDIHITKTESGDMKISGDEGEFVFKVNKLKSVIKGLDDKEEIFKSNYMRFLMKNGNVITMKFQ